MGGRGGYSGFGGGSGGKSLFSTIGKKGKPMSIGRAIKVVNPRYAWEWDERYSPIGYDENCQRCVLATELQARGYDVEALPAPVGKTERLQTSRGASLYFSDSKYINKLGKRASTVEKNIVSQMKKWGDGSRAFMSVSWKGMNGGHYVNLEYKQYGDTGVVLVYDGQNGTTSTLGEILSKTDAKFTGIIRSDNLKKPNPEWIKKAVKRRTK